jgi:hypothetical protein
MERCDVLQIAGAASMAPDGPEGAAGAAPPSPAATVLYDERHASDADQEWLWKFNQTDRRYYPKLELKKKIQN